MLGATLAAVVIVAFPMRIQLARAEFDRQARRWAEAKLQQSAMLTASHQLESAATTDDAATLARTQRELDDELTSRIKRLRRQILSERTPDPSMRRLRSALALALQAGHPPDKAERLLDQQRQRFRRPAVVPHHTPRFPAADRAMAALGHFLDEPTGVSIVTVSRATVLVIDIDRSTAQQQRVNEWVPFGFDPSAVVVRRTYAAVAIGGTAYKIAPDLSRPPQRLGRADWIEAGDGPDNLRLVKFNPIDSTSTASVVDADGRELSSPGPFEPIGDVLSPQTDGGELVDQHDGHSAVGRIVAGTEVVDLVDPGGRSVRVQTPAGLRPDACKFSPRADTVACTFEPAEVRTLPLPLRLGLVDPATGAVRMVDGQAGSGPFHQMQWTATGDRLFISTAATHPMATYRMGDTRVVPLRYTGTDILDFVLIPASP